MRAVEGISGRHPGRRNAKDLLLFDGDDLAASILAAGRADAMGDHQLVAV